MSISAAIPVANLAAANFPLSVAGLHIGAFVNGTSLALGFVGAIHEIYTTTDVSAGNVDAITAELETAYGL